MTVATGAIIYKMGSARCTGIGLLWSRDELSTALRCPIAASLFDDEGAANIEEVLSAVAETEFARDGLRRVLRAPDEFESWRVGEAIAEVYLTGHRSCRFPWPDVRDERRGGSSLPGADLVGFGIDEEGDCLVFGEVKTSSDPGYPPGVMYGRTGLKRQLEDIRDSEILRDTLLKYLGHRAGSAPWRARFEQAGRRYLQNKSDFQSCGFLVRDVTPHQNDLRAPVSSLAAGSSEETRMELLALYLPPETLDGIGDLVLSMRTGNGL